MERVVLEASWAEAPCSIEEGLMVTRYLGRERAREMAVNVVLPFFWASGVLTLCCVMPASAYSAWSPGVGATG